MVTAELAAALPVLALFALVGLGALADLSTRIRAQDAAHEMARLVARGDRTGADTVVRRLDPGATATIESTPDLIRVTLCQGLRPLGSVLPSMTVCANASAAPETDPSASDGPGGELTR